MTPPEPKFTREVMEALVQRGLCLVQRTPGSPYHRSASERAIRRVNSAMRSANGMGAYAALASGGAGPKGSRKVCRLTLAEFQRAVHPLLVEFSSSGKAARPGSDSSPSGRGKP